MSPKGGNKVATQNPLQSGAFHEDTERISRATIFVARFMHFDLKRCFEQNRREEKRMEQNE